jgi:cell volume regulation protein A
VLGFGILLGPVLGFFEKDLFLAISPLMSTVALSIILFDAGINVDITQVMKATFRSSVLSIATILAVIFSIGYILSWMLPSSFTLLQGMLLGAMIGGTSTISVFGVISGLEKIFSNIEGTKLLLLMESVVSDPICIIASITIIKMIMLPSISIQDVFEGILYTFLIASLIGFMLGIVWALVLDLLREKPFNYLITLAILFPVYLLAESVGGPGAGPVSALTFGLALTNFRYIARPFGVYKKVRVDKIKLREFHEEITFFVKAFFFVYIGLIVTLSLRSTVLGIVLFALIFGVRYIVVKAVGKVFNFSLQDEVLSILIYVSGLPAFVMSQLPMIFDPDKQFFLNPEIYPNLTMPIVLSSVIFGAIAGPIIAKKRFTDNAI